MAIAKAGKLLCVDQGAWSDYCVMGFFVVLADFDPLAESEKYLNTNSDQRGEYSFSQDKFLAYLIAQGLLLEVDYQTLYLGSYRASEVKFRVAEPADTPNR